MEEESGSEGMQEDWGNTDKGTSQVKEKILGGEKRLGQFTRKGRNLFRWISELLEVSRTAVGRFERERRERKR